MKIYTIGFTKKSAETFFMRLQNAGIQRLVDVRLNNVSQLAGFAKKDDLRYFVKTICNADYTHLIEMAPTAEILDPYKKAKNGDRALYEHQFLDLMRARQIEQTSRDILENACLLCSEEKPDHYRRRLVAEYLREHWGNVQIEHLV
jgi:uncharacterized protein (DUF488 family)